MKTILGLCLLSLSFQSFAGAQLVSKNDGIIKLTGDSAKVMLKTILKAPVKVTANAYELKMTTKGQNFDSVDEIDIRTYVTGKITCLKSGKSCIVDGSEVRNSRDGWFSPEVGYYRVFGLGKLAQLDEGYFNCGRVYENVACDFKMK